MEKNIKNETRVQFALVAKKDGSPATLTHQDDLESPLIDETLEGLASQFADWIDRSGDDCLKELETGGDYEKYEIVRQEVKTLPLTADDKAEIKKLIKEASDEDGEDGEGD